MIYIAMETKYPPNVINQADENALSDFYIQAIDESLNAVNGELISIKDIYYNGKPGKEYRCSFSEGKALMVYRYYFINDNFYSIGVITSPNKDENKGMKKFFDSFGIKK